MIRRHREPPPPWRRRLDAARAMIDAHRPDATVTARLADVEAALEAAVADRTGLRASLSALDPDRVGAELKAALRARSDVTAPDTDVVASLRQRHHVVHSLRNRLRVLDERIETTLVDLDTLAAHSVELDLARQGSGSLGDDLLRLQADIVALTGAHEELDRSVHPGSGPST